MDDGVLLWNLLMFIYVIYSGFIKMVIKIFEKKIIYECVCIVVNNVS